MAASSAAQQFGNQLVEACLAGERAALERLYQEMARPVLSVAMNILGDQSVAEDILHDVYLKALKRLDRWRQGSELSTWIYRIAVNECLSWRRKIAVRLTSARTLQSENVVAAVSPNGDAAIEAKRFLAGLDLRTRAVVVLKHVEGLTFEEIAAILHEPVGTLKSLASRALREGARRLE